MAQPLYAALASLDGYVADETGNFDWAAPDEEVHAYVNDLERPIGTYLYGRRMYETMAVWETMGSGPGDPEVIRDYGEIWRAAEKVVYSATLTEASSARTQIEPAFEPAAGAEVLESARSDVAIGGSTLAAAAFAAGLIDECRLLLVPVSVGGGKPA